MAHDINTEVHVTNLEEDNHSEKIVTYYDLELDSVVIESVLQIKDSKSKHLHSFTDEGLDKLINSLQELRERKKEESL
jgi:hypothetical protein